MKMGLHRRERLTAAIHNVIVEARIANMKATDVDVDQVLVDLESDIEEAVVSALDITVEGE